MASSNHKAPASKFMPSGYDYEFVLEVPEEYICNICFSPMWKPVQTKCGHRFCKDCLEEANKRKNPPQCPEDRQELRKNKDIFEDKAAERRILSFVIKCPNEGCPWQGELGDFKGHTCNPVHKNLAVICPNKCGEKIKKDEISNHVSQHCALTFVPCVYHRFGCNVRTPRKDMNKHMEKSIGHHFNITCERLLSLEDENRKLNDKQKEVEQQVHNFKDSLMKERKEQRSAVKELTDIKTKVEQHSVKLDKALQSLNNQKSEFTKEIRTLKQQRGQQEVDEDAKNRNDVKILEEKLDEKISSCYVYMETSVDQLHRDFENKAVKLTNLLRKDLISFYFLMIVLFWCAFASKSDTIETRLTELVQDIKHVNARLSHKFIFNIENFNDMLRRAKKTGGDYVHRQAFYNKKYGYKFKVIVYPNGYGEGKDTYVSLHIQMIRGKYDAILPWPFTEKIKISILGQDGNISQRSIAEANIDPTKISKYFRKPITASNEPYVFDTFVSHERLALEGIFYTDSLFVKVEYESV